MEGRGITWIVAMVSFAVSVTAASAVADPNETAALLAFKKSLIDENGRLNNWQGNDPCGPPTWTGVYCEVHTTTNVSHVTEIHVLRFNLGGTLARELGNLPYLTTLDVMWNHITGSIPLELGNLTSIYLLLLNGNQLTGPIPQELSKLTGMNRLQLDTNLLNGTIPDVLGNLTLLRHLHLNNNSFTGSIPSSFGRSDSKLTHVLVDNNQLSGPLPASLELCPKLTIIQVDNNPIRSTIPSTWAQMAGLMKLSLRNCSITGTIPDLGAMTNLTYLDLSLNQLEEMFPTNFSSKLLTIDVSKNFFVGQIPDTVSYLQDVQSLQFSFNGFNGSVPVDLGSGASFKNDSLKLLVDLRNNSLTGLNAEITNATNANHNVTLRLFGNPLCGQNGVISNTLKLEYCIDGNQAMDDPASNNTVTCAKCNLPNMAVLDPPGKCRCARPIELVIRLKSPSFSFFDRFQAKFLYLLTSILNLNSSQVQIGELDWEVGPRLRLVLYLFPTNTTFNTSEFEQLFSIVANWDLSAGTDWSLSVLGPYELLNFSEVVGSKSSGLSKGVIVAIVIGSIAGIVSLSVLLILALYRKRLHKAWSNVPASSFSERSLAMLPLGVKLAGVKAFKYEEVAKATNNFHMSTELGRGGYGHVYKGVLEDGTIVAVKRADRSSLQGSDQFYTEIELLSRVHHRNLVSLIAFCNDQNEQMLIYEFMPGGNLRDHLIPTEILDYPTRVRIAVGTAKGILYLHTEANPPIFHRDIKASNILLDEKFNAKVADFGLSKLAPTPDMSGSTPEGISTNVRGTPGYVDPEYFMTNKLTDKSDVYSFGIVLLELITGMLPIAHGKNIVREIQDALTNKTFWDLVDPCMGTYPHEGVESLLQLALSCVSSDQDERPAMVEVSRELENIQRKTCALESPMSSKASISNMSSFGTLSDKWPLRRAALEHEYSWASIDGLGDHSHSQSIPSQTKMVGPR